MASSGAIWRTLPELNSRQLGLTLPYPFTKRASASINMVQRLKLQTKLDFHDGCVNTLNFNPSGELLASGSDDLDIAIWNWAKEKKILSYESGHHSNVFQAKFMPFTNDSTIVSCARDGQIRVGYLDSAGQCRSTKRVGQHRGAAHKLCIEPASQFTFLTCGEDGMIIEVDLRDSKANKLMCCRASEHKKVALYTIFINPENINEFSVGGRDQFVRVYDKRKLDGDTKSLVTPVKQFCPHHLENIDYYATVTCLVYSYDGSEILASYNDEDIYLFDSNSSSGSEYTKRYKGHRNNATVKGVNFYGPHSDYVVSGSDCGHIYFWNKETAEIVQFLEGDESGVVNCLEPHPHCSIIATSGLDHDIKIWSPTAAENASLSKVSQVTSKNEKEREEERHRPADPISEQLLWLMMHHIRRRQVVANNGADDTDSSDFDNEEEDDDEDDDGELSRRVQCSPS